MDGKDTVDEALVDGETTVIMDDRQKTYRTCGTKQPEDIPQDWRSRLRLQATLVRQDGLGHERPAITYFTRFTRCTNSMRWRGPWPTSKREG